MFSREKRGKIWLVIVSCCSLFLLLAAARNGLPEPKLQPTAKPGDCSACHGKDILPDRHSDTKEMNWKGCQTCHKKDKMALVSKMPGSHLHQLEGINCVSCHGKTEKPEALEMDKCVACHGSTAALAEKTAKVKPENPHTSPHYGTELDCNLCHHQHKKSENYCSQCHKFDFIVP